MNHNIRTTHKVIVTGGHVTPALATIGQIMSRYPTWEIVFVGRRIALEGQRIESEEYRLVRGLGIRFISIVAGRIKRDAGILTFLAVCKIPIGLVQALWIIMTERPDVIMSFGGYVAVPIVIAAWIGRIPIVTHEQTTRPGLANRFIARLATRICVSFPGQEAFFSKSVIQTGLPLRKSIFLSGTSAEFTLDSHVPTLFVTGGSTGSVSINRVVYEALPLLLKHFTVMHQVGRFSIGTAIAVQKKLSIGEASRYHPMAYLSDTAYAWVLQHAALVVGRSGANTVMEVAALGKIAVWIPLPWASEYEQQSNAEFLVHAGSASMIDQASFTPTSLVDAVTSMMEKRHEYTSAAERLAKTIPRDGADRVVDVLYTLLCDF